MANDMCVPEISTITHSLSTFRCIILFIDHVSIYLCMIVCLHVQLCSVCLLFPPSPSHHLFFLLEKVTVVEVEPGLGFPNWGSMRSPLCCSLVSDIIRNHLQQSGPASQIPTVWATPFRLCLMIKGKGWRPRFSVISILYTLGAAHGTLSLTTRASC